MLSRSRLRYGLLYSLGLAAALLPGLASAQAVEIGTGTTTVQTSTAGTGGVPADVTITTGSTRTPSTGPGLVIDSANTAINLGTITRTDTLAGAQVVIGAGTGRVFINRGGTISISDGYTRANNNGAWAEGSDRVGVLVGEAGVGTAGTVNIESGSITVDGNNSAGVRFAGPFTGNLFSAATITMVGANSAAVEVNGPFIGNIDLRGTMSVQGDNSSALRIAGPVTGSVEIAANIATTAYSTITRGAIATPDADDLLQAGPAVLITSSISSGLTFMGAGVEQDPDDDGDGILDDAATNPDTDDNRITQIQLYGGGPAVQIGDGTNAMTLGATSRFGSGLVNRGSIRTDGIYDGFSTSGMRINTGVTIAGGMLNQGSIGATAARANSFGLHIAGANVGVLRSTNAIASTVTDGSSSIAAGILIEAGSLLGTLTNSGTIASSIQGGTGTSIGIRDLSGTLGLITNSGTIFGRLAAAQSGGAVATGTAIAIDVSANTTGVTVRQIAPMVDPEDDTVDQLVATTPLMEGEVRFGVGADTFEIGAGTATGAISFGTGADRLLVSGGTLTSLLSDTDGLLDVTLTGGTLRTLNTTPLAISNLSIASGARWTFEVDLGAGTATGFNVAGTATIAQGAVIAPSFTGTRRTQLVIPLLTAGTLDWQGTGASFDFTNLPFLYQASIDRTGTQLNIRIDTRNAEQLGLTSAEGGALEAVLALASTRADLSRGLNQQTSGTGWRDAYRRLLPDYTDGKVAMAMAGLRGASQAVRDVLERSGEERPDFLLWGQHFAFADNLEPQTDQQRQGGGFGFTAGVGSYLGPFDLVGLSATFTTGSYDRDASDFEDAENFAISSMSLGTFAVYREGGFRADVSLAAGYDWSTSERRVVLRGADGTATSGIDETAAGDWKGWRVGASSEVSWETALTERIGIMPFARIDAVRLTEDGYTETGAPGLALQIEDFESTRAIGRAGAELSRTFGIDEAWKVSLRGGVSNTFLDDDSGRRAKFVAAGDFFELDTPEQDSTGAFASLGVSLDGDAGIGSFRLDYEQLGDRQSIGASISFRLRY
jgi:hypothetical protein